MTADLVKVGWIRDPNKPLGKTAPGHLNCPCGKAPLSCFEPKQKTVRCHCGRTYTWNGYLVRGPAKAIKTPQARHAR